MSTENNNLFTDFEPLKNAGTLSAVDFSASEPLSGLTDGLSPRFQGLIPEPTDALFEKMWESCDSLNNSGSNASISSQNDRTEFQPLSPDAFMSPVSVLEGRGSAPIFDDVLPEQNRSTWISPKPTQSAVPDKTDEIAYFEQLWESGEFPQNETRTALDSGIDDVALPPASKKNIITSLDDVDIPQLLGVNPNANTQENKSDVEEKKPELLNKLDSELQSKPEPPQDNKAKKSVENKSNNGWTLSLISALTALIVGLFIFGWNMLPAYLVQYQIEQATGLSLKMKNVSQDYRSGITNVESVQALDSAQRIFFETGHAAFSSLPYYIGDNQQMKWAMVEGIRFAPTPQYVNPNGLSLRDNEFNKAVKSVQKELDDSQIELLVKNSVSTISSPYEQSILHAQQEVKDITQQIQVLQERLLASREEATDADKAQAASYQQRMKMALSNMSIEESRFNQRTAALMNNIRSKREERLSESNVPALTNGTVTEYLFGQDYTEFTGLLLYEIRQFCRWLPTDLEKALGPVDKLDPSALSFRRIATQEQLAVGQLRLTGQTQFMNQTVPFSAVITNYSTTPNGKPLLLDIAFGEDQSARLRLEARRGDRTEIKVEFVSSNVNPGTQFGQEDGLHIKLEPDEKTPFIQTRSIQFVVADGKIQGEYAMAQTAPSISIGFSGVRSEANAAKVQELSQSVEKITLNGTISGQFAKPKFNVCSNLESLGASVLTIAANEYDQRMESYRTAIEKKSAEIIEEEQKRIANVAGDVKVSANGNALLLNQLCSGVVESQIVVEKTPENEAAPDAEILVDSGDDLTLPSLEEQAAQDNAAATNSPEDLPFPELPVPEPEPAQASAQIAAGDVDLAELPPLNGSDELSPMEPESNVMESTDPQVEQSNSVDMVEEYPELPALPSVEELLSDSADATGGNQETNSELTRNSAVDQQSQVFEELPSLEEIIPQNGIPLTAPQIDNNNSRSAGNAPMELQASPENAMDITSPAANYESPEMEFLDEDNTNGSNTAAPLEEALPVEGVSYEEVIPMDVPPKAVVPRRTTPPLPIIIDEE